MKKVAKLFTVLLLGMSVSMSVHAAADAGVWCETNVGTDNNLSLSIETNGKVTDGVLTIDYKTSVVSCDEDDVKIADSVEMSSVNVVDGSVKISFLSEEPLKEGTIAQIAFEAVDENVDKETFEAAIGLTGEAHDAEGEQVPVNPDEEEPTETPAVPTETPAAPTPTPEGPTETPAAPTPTAPAATETPQPTATPGNNGGGDSNQNNTGSGGNSNDTGSSQEAVSAKTSDESKLFTYVILAVAAGGLLAVFAVRRFKAHPGKKSE